MKNDLKAKKAVVNESSELEVQYQKLFSPIIPKTEPQPSRYTQPAYYEEFVTWVRVCK